jgi:hypothetical protein
MSIRPKIPGCLILLVVLLVPGLLAGYLLKSPRWIAIIPGGFVLLMLVIAALPIKRKITPQQFADELEAHLLGTDGDWGWDDAISVSLADERLERLRHTLAKFDRLESEERKSELRLIIETLRRGEVPDINLNS